MLDRTSQSPQPRPAREPMFHIPPGVALVLLVLIFIHLVRDLASDAFDVELLSRLGFVPGRATYALDPAPVVEALMRLAAAGGADLRAAQAGRFFLGDGSAQPWTLLTYGLLHVDWTHVGLNSIWLLAFGTPVARRFGTPRFLALLAVTTLAGALAHWVTHLTDLEPVIGASAAVSGCMGASLRFMFRPRAPLSALVGLAPEGRDEAFRQPALSLFAVLRDRKAAAFLVAWFVTNLIFGLASSAFGFAEGPVAWQAHIGGFLAGLLLFRLFEPASGTPPPGAAAAGI